MTTSEHAWNDAAWMATRKARSAPDAPISIYEVHLGSWMRVPEEGNRSLTYREIAPKLVEYVTRLGFTHVELMPLTEQPPEDLMALVDALHTASIAVIIDWVPAHVDVGRQDARSSLLSSALYWSEKFHIDGLRVDAVTSMHSATEQDGLVFPYKWDMGWMHDTLAYLREDPIHRKHHHDKLTRRGLYGWSERFVLPLSHDEVVHGKGSLIGKMPGDQWQKFASLRLLLAYMFAVPGKKLLFMGSEIAQQREWNPDASLDWSLLDEPSHRQIQLLVGELNRLYKSEPALHELDCDPSGFRWIDADDAERSVLVFERIARDGGRMICAMNFTPVPRSNYRIGVAQPGTWSEILNTDAHELGGSGQGNLGAVATTPVRAHGREQSINVTLPPLGAVFLRR